MLSLAHTFTLDMFQIIVVSVCVSSECVLKIKNSQINYRYFYFILYFKSLWTYTRHSSGVGPSLVFYRIGKSLVPGTEPRALQMHSMCSNIC